MVEYGIYTEDKNRKKILRIVGRTFPGFSVQEQIGYWKGKEEKSLYILILGEEKDAQGVRKVAKEIKSHNKQQSVLLTIGKVHTKFL